MTLGFYENFPQNVHRIESFNSNLSSKQLQQKLIQVFYNVNQREFSFEDIANPTVPQAKVIFEFGLAEAENFNYIDEEELKKAMDLLGKERLHSIDFFCAVCYYKGNREKKTTLKFDYYLLRTIYSKDKLEVQVFHERGPRYISPEDLAAFIYNRLNEASPRAILRKIEP